MNGNSNLIGAEALPNAPPLNELNDVPDERGGGATRNAYAIYDLPRHRLIHHLLPQRAAAHLVAARARRLGQRVRDRVVHGRAGGARRRGSRDLPAVAALRSARARAWSRPPAQMSGWFESRTRAAKARARGFGFARYKNIASFAAVVVEVEVDEEVRLEAGLVLRRRRPGDHAGRRQEPDRGRHHQGASFVMKERVRFADGKVATATWEDYPILRFSEVPEIDIRLIDAPNEPALGLGEASVGPTGAAIGNAVARALGKRIRDLPLTRERIMATLLAE